MPLFLPPLFICLGQGIQIARLRLGIIDPLPEEGASIDEVDGQAGVFVFIAKVPPKGVVRIKVPDGFECQGLKAPWLEQLMVVGRIVRMDLYPCTKLARVLVKGGFEPTGS